MLTYDPEKAVAHLRKADPALARVIEAVGPLTLEPRDGAFRSLARAIFFQQLAGPAARAIMGRALAALGSDEGRFFTPQQLLAASDDELRAAGLSRQKLAYLRDLSEKFAGGQLSEGEFAAEEDEEVIRKVTAGQGDRPLDGGDVPDLLAGPAGRAAGGRPGCAARLPVAYGLDDLPKPEEMRRIAEPWRPYRSAGTWYMWRSLGVALPEEGR